MSTSKRKVRVPTPLFLAVHRGLIAFLLIACFTGKAQTPSFNFQKLGTEEGLNNANIFNIEQHENGLMYVTTQNGIYYYDGFNFNKLSIDSLKSNALINATILNRDTLLLSMRDEGFATFSLRSNTYALDKRLKLPDNNADQIIITDRYAYMIITGIRLVIVDLQTGKVIPDELKKKQNLAYALYKTRDGKMLVGRSDGLYEARNGVQSKLDVPINSTVYSIIENSEGRILLGTMGRIVFLNNYKVEREIVPSFKVRSNTFSPGGEMSINKLVADKFGRIWFTSYPEDNLYLYENNTVFDIFELLDIPSSLIKSLFKDKDENIWIGTNNDGIYYIQNPFFNSINFSLNGKFLNINQVFLKDNLLVAATSNGLYGLNLYNYQTKTLSKPDEIFLEPIYNIVESEGIFYYSKRNEMNVFPTIFFVADKSYKFRPVIASLFYPLGDGRSVISDFDRNILLCNSDGSRTLDTLISFSDYRIVVNCVLKHNDILYVGTTNGLFTYSFKEKVSKNLVRNELNYNINDVALINGKLFAAHEGGITDINEGKLYQSIGDFRLNAVRKIRAYNEQVWLATLDGVYICDKDLNPVKTLNKSNGLLSNSVNDITFSGDMVGISTARGVSITNFKNILRYNAKLPPVTIDRLESNGRKFHAGKHKLSAAEENVSVQFFSPLYNKPSKQYFRWRLDNGSWKYMTTTAFEINLPAGEHTLDISASADNIVWSDNTTLEFDRAEKLSEKQSLYWLVTLCAIVLIGVVSFVWIRRIKIKSKRRLQEEQQVNLLKHQAMNSLLSPHFIFNSLTSIQNYINTNNGLRASEYLAKFSRLIRMIIEKAAQSHISLHDELARLTYYLELEKERFKNKFDYEISLDADINTHETQIPNMIIQPYVENCIIHGILPKHEHGRLHLRFRKGGANMLQIIIEDNGIGIIKAREHAKTGHKSLGTSTIQGILEINSKLSGKKQRVSMTDKSTLDPAQSGTIIEIDLEL